jgi:hypothetical protein
MQTTLGGFVICAFDGRDQRLMVGDDVERHRCRLR